MFNVFVCHFVRLCDKINPAELSLSTAALAGNGALSFMNKSFSFGQTLILHVFFDAP